MAEEQIGVLIDYENVGLGSIQALFDQLSDMGRIIIKRAYADWSRGTVKSGQMLELGIEARQHFHPTGSGKNSSDIALAIEAVGLMYTSSVSTFVIVSSDTDFVPLVSTLRAAGKTVIGAGRRGVVPPGLVRSCDRYIYLEEGTPTAQANSDLQRQADSLLVRAVTASTDDQDQVVAAKLHNTMRRMDPSFDFRSFGYRTFTQFLAASPLVSLQRPRGRGDAIVELVAGQNHNEPVIQPAIPQAGFSEAWDAELDVAWAAVPGSPVAGSKAASEAAKVLGVSKVSASRFKNLQGLLDASELLRSKWTREGNAIRRR